MKLTFVLAVLTVALVGVTGVVGATEVTGVAGGIEETGVPPLPGNETTTANDSTEDSDRSSDDSEIDVSPGQQLAGAVGAQGASVQSELWNRTLTERLANATTESERAEVLADEVDLLVASVETLDGAKENLTDAWADGELSEGKYRASLAEFVVRASTVERRANQTARAAAGLPRTTREIYDVNVTEIEAITEQARDLYQFEGEIAREVTNETLSNQSTESDRR